MAINTTHAEMAGWPREVQTLSGFQAVRAIRVAWASRYTLLGELLNWSNIYQYPTTPSNYNAICTSVQMRPLPNCEVQADSTVSNLIKGSSTDFAAQYDFALVMAKYETGSWGIHGSNLVTERLQAWAMTRPLDHRGLGFGSSTLRHLKPGERPHKIVPVMKYMRKYHRLATIHTDVVDLIGKTNSKEFATLLLNKTGGDTIAFAQGTCLYVGPVARRTLTTTGAGAIDLEEHFLIAPEEQDWDKDWDMEIQDWGELKDMGGTQVTKYNQVDFANL